jgi:uncharacterized cupredoxin-like copper-binding protein
MKRLAVLTPFVLAAVIAGCGSSSSSSSSAAASGSSTVSGASSAAAASSGGGGLTLNESEFKIDPAHPKVAKGAITITVKNTGAVTHALTVQTPSGPVSTGNIAPGKTTTLKVNIAKAGTYKFFCPIPGHEQAGMKGTLVVD